MRWGTMVVNWIVKDRVESGNRRGLWGWWSWLYSYLVQFFYFRNDLLKIRRLWKVGLIFGGILGPFFLSLFFELDCHPFNMLILEGNLFLFEFKIRFFRNLFLLVFSLERFLLIQILTFHLEAFSKLSNCF